MDLADTATVTVTEAAKALKGTGLLPWCVAASPLRPTSLATAGSADGDRAAEVVCTPWEELTAALNNGGGLKLRWPLGGMALHVPSLDGIAKRQRGCHAGTPCWPRGAPPQTPSSAEGQ